jgi:hypothetical protein
MDEWCAAMQSQDEDHRAYSRSEALTWVHSNTNTGAHPWCPAHGALRQAAWIFWQEARQHKEVLGEDEDAPGPLPTPTGPTLGAWPEFAARAAGSSCGPVSSCVAKATEVVRRLPRAGVALLMPFLGDFCSPEASAADDEPSWPGPAGWSNNISNNNNIPVRLARGGSGAASEARIEKSC